MEGGDYYTDKEEREGRKGRGMQRRSDPIVDTI